MQIPVHAKGGGTHEVSFIRTCQRTRKKHSAAVDTCHKRACCVTCNLAPIANQLFTCDDAQKATLFLTQTSLPLPQRHGKTRCASATLVTRTVRCFVCISTFSILKGVAMGTKHIVGVKKSSYAGELRKGPFRMRQTSFFSTLELDVLRIPTTLHGYLTY